MKEQEAIRRGYGYTGISDLGRYHEGDQTFEEKLAEIRKNYKAVIVNMRTSSYSRSSPGMPYRTIYVEKKYHLDRELKNLELSLSRIPNELENALREYDKKVQDIREREEKMKARMIEIQNHTTTYSHPALNDFI